MTEHHFRELLRIAHQSGRGVLVWGAGGIGKTERLLAEYPKAAVLHPSEIREDNLPFFRSVIDTHPVVLIENIDENCFSRVLPFLNQRYCFGKPLDTFFLMTAGTPYPHSSLLQIPLESPSTESWLEWAANHGIHPALFQVVQETDLLRFYPPKTLTRLSDVLHAGVPEALLETVLLSFLKNDPELFARFAKLYDTAIVPKPASADRRQLTQSGQGELEALEKLLEENIRFQPEKLHNEDLLAFLLSVEPERILRTLKLLLESSRAEPVLRQLLQSPDLRRVIDMLVEKA